MTYINSNINVYNNNSINEDKNKDLYQAKYESNADISIFSENRTQTNQSGSLRDEFENIQDEQGFLGKLWDGIKNITGLGLGSNKVEDAIEDYEKGEITYDEALSQIQSFEQKQEDGVNIITNVASGAATAAIAIGTGGIGLGVIGAGAIIGAGAKAGLKTVDRATNKVEGDALDAKQIVKDSLTGAVDGAINVATGGMVGKAAGTLGKSIANGAIQGAKAGAISGAAAGATEYTVNSLVDGEEFTFEGLISSTAQNAAAGGVFGGVFGGVSGAIDFKTKVKISHDDKLGSPVDTKKQVESYIENYNLNHPDDPIKLEDIARKTKDFTDMSKASKELAKIFDGQIDEAALQISKVFGNKEDIARLTARAKGQKSTFEKLAGKDLKGKVKSYDPETYYKTISDALGVRIQMKSLDEKTSKEIVESFLADTDLTYDDFRKFISGTDVGEDTAKILSGRQNDILTALKTKQTQSIVDQMVEGIKTGKLHITEINNYGDDLTSYFTDAQVLEIADAYDYAVKNGIIKSTEPFEIVTLNDLEFKNANTHFEDDETMIIELPSKAKEGETFTIRHKKKAVKDSGYTSTQMNTKHNLHSGQTGNGELQIRGTEVNGFADVEHIPYDIRTGKIAFDDPKYSSIYKIIKDLDPDTTYKAYNQYLADTYKALRLKELGLLPTDYTMPEIGNFVKGVDKEILELIDWAGLAKVAGGH